MEDKTEEMRSLALTPTWSVASVLTFFVAVSLLVERSIHWLSNVSFHSVIEFSLIILNVGEVFFCFPGNDSGVGT